jgi:ribosomal protein S18 acetylase RimI-like enzyme
MDVKIRKAEPSDSPGVVSLLRELATSLGENIRVTEAHVAEYLASPGSGILIAVASGEVAGLLSYSRRRDLYHAGETCLIEELVVKDSLRGKGIGAQLINDVVARVTGCVEISVSVMPDNEGALRFYRAHGFTDEAVFLEKHLGDA